MIKVRNLDYTYKNSDKHAIKNISFDIKKGEVFGFLGPSGAGKSTTQKILIKLLDGYKGDVQVFGKNLNNYNSTYYENVGVGFELPNSFTKLTAVENLKFFKSFYKNQTVDIEELLKRVGLYDQKDDLISSYSKGMKMRLNFLRALINDGELIILDEPTSGLDPVNAQIIKDMIIELKNLGKTIFLTTHDMYVADVLCDRVAFIVDGEIKELDAPKDLKLKYGKKQVTIEYYKNDSLHTQSYDLNKLGSNEDFLTTIKENEIRTIHSEETSLEQVFIKVTGRSLS